MPRPLSDDARQSMITSTRKLIAESGVHALTIEDVARRSGVAKTTIYRHFASLDDLVLAAVDGAVKAAEAPDTGTLEGDLRIVQQRYIQMARSDRQRELFAWMMSRSAHDPEFAMRFRRVRVQPGGATTIVLQRAIARGEVAADLDLALALHLVQGPFMSKRFVENEDVTDVELDALVTMIAAALRSTRCS
jgi:AcrR family transcriptional regulator